MKHNRKTKRADELIKNFGLAGVGIDFAAAREITRELYQDFANATSIEDLDETYKTALDLSFFEYMKGYAYSATNTYAKRYVDISLEKIHKRDQSPEMKKAFGQAAYKSAAEHLKKELKLKTDPRNESYRPFEGLYNELHAKIKKRIGPRFKDRNEGDLNNAVAANEGVKVLRSLDTTYLNFESTGIIPD